EAPASFATFLYPYRSQTTQTRPHLMSQTLEVENEEWWAWAVETTGEYVEILVSKTDRPEHISFWSKVVGEVVSEASGLVLRQPDKGKRFYGGAWNVTSYRNHEVSFELSTPSDLVFSRYKNKLLMFNSGAHAVQLTVYAPFRKTVDLPKEKWVEISA